MLLFHSVPLLPSHHSCAHSACRSACGFTKSQTCQRSKRCHSFALKFQYVVQRFVAPWTGLIVKHHAHGSAHSPVNQQVLFIHVCRSTEAPSRLRCAISHGFRSKDQPRHRGFDRVFSAEAGLNPFCQPLKVRRSGISRCLVSL